jgi:hypothetical protein
LEGGGLHDKYRNYEIQTKNPSTIPLFFLSCRSILLIAHLMKNTSIFLVVISLLLFSSSCIRDIEESLQRIENIDGVRMNPTYALPLIDSKVTLANILKNDANSFISIDDENLIHVIYRSKLASLRARDLVSLKDEKFSATFSLNSLQVAEMNANGSTTMNVSTVMNFGPEDMEIDSILMKACGLFVGVESNLQHDVNINLQFPDIKKDGADLQANLSLPFLGPSPVNANINRDLKGYKFDLTKSGDKAFSQLKLNVVITITKNINYPVNEDDEVTFRSEFLYNEYHALYGYLGELDASPTSADTVHFDMFSAVDGNSTTGTFSIEDPKFKLIISNSYGVPIRGIIDEVASYSKVNGKIVATGIPNPLKIPRPNKNQIGMVIKDSFKLNSSNSNIKDLVSSIPEFLIYRTGVIINPPGTKERNFINFNSVLEFEVDVDVPLHGTADGFILEHQVDFSTDIENVEELESATLRLFVQNEFPIDVGLQVYFVDSTGKVLDSLITPYQLILKSALVGSDGKLIEAQSTTLDFVLDQARLKRIESATEARIRATLNTYKPAGVPQPPVKFFSNYGINLKLGVEAKVLLEQKF